MQYATVTDGTYKEHGTSIVGREKKCSWRAVELTSLHLRRRDAELWSALELHKVVILHAL